MITFGYVGGPAASGQAIQAATVVPGPPVSVVLGSAYWPVDIAGVLGSAGARPSFDGAAVPFMVKQGTCLTLSKTEAAALIAAGVAQGV